jgi:UDP:flavonoid glycosyltransferase YjiC (YdhE family)
LALGRGLRAAGHKVLLATHADFEDLACRSDLDFYPLAGGARALQDSTTGREMVNAGRNLFAYLRAFASLRVPLMREMLAQCDEACRGADLIVLTQTAAGVGLSVAEKRGVPVCLTLFQPTVLSRFLPSCFFPEAPGWFPGRRLYNQATHVASLLYLWQQVRPALNDARRDVLGLPPFPWRGPSTQWMESLPTLFAFSPLVIPKPPDWGANHHLTGYWFLDEALDWQPPHDLREFLQAGPPPVSIGFGSMTNGRGDAALAAVLGALELTGQRAVLLTGWGGLGRPRSTDRVFVTDFVPHDWLFPRTSAVVHHGGAGTTSAALRAGVPSLVVPFSGDQFFWGKRVFTLGVGPRPLPRKRLTAERLAEALRTVATDSSLRERAAALGEQIRAEDGVGRAVRLIEDAVPAPGVNGKCRRELPVEAVLRQRDGSLSTS